MFVYIIDNLPLLTVICFLLSTLGVGLYFSKKTITLREYAVGNKKFATATLVATMLATKFGGEDMMLDVEQVHNRGIYWIFLILSSSLPFLLLSRLVLRMGPFMQHLSMPETIGSIYGTYPRIIAALSSICNSIAGIAIQITVMSKIITMCIGSLSLQHIQYVTLLAALVLIFYSSFGGIRSVTFTDVLQFITFTIVIPLLALFIYQKIDKPASHIIPFLHSHTKFQLSTLYCWDTKLIATIAMILSFLVVYIEHSNMQRIYMASSVLQARQVCVYVSIFNLIITGCIILIGLFVFVAAPTLSVTEIWPYIMTHIPLFFKGFIAISLLAMAMSTADSDLNTCSVIISHDIWSSIQKIRKMPAVIPPLLLVRLATVVVGLTAMLLAFKYNALLELMYLAFDFFVPIVTAPFLLAIFGFRGTSRTALIGMVTGVVTILAWNKWVEPGTDIHGSFICMLANGLAILAAHYLLPQPPGTGWVGPDDELKQIRQANERKKARRKEEFKLFFSKDNLAKLKPTTVRLVGIGIYVITTSLLDRFVMGVMDPTYWPIFQIMVGACFVGYGIFIPKPVPDWKVGRNWLIGLAFYFPVNILWHLWHATDSLLTLTLTLVHLSITLWVLPLYLGLLVSTPLIIVYAICCIKALLLWGITPLLLLGLGLLMYAIIICDKFRNNTYKNQIDYLKNQQKLKEAQKLKNIAYNLNINASIACNELEQDGTILERVVKDVTQSISFLDDHPLYKQDFQSIINKFSEWALCLKKQAKSKDHILLIPTEISINALMNKIEVALAQEMGNNPRLLIEHKDNTVPVKIVCDAGQIIQLLVTAVLHTAKPDGLDTKFVRIQLYTTHLQYEKSDPIHNEYAPTMVFPAIAMVVSNATTPPAAFPKIQSYYEDITDRKKPKWHSNHLAPERLDLGKKTIERIIQAHYGYLEVPNQSVMLLVLPCNVTSIREEMIAKLPMESLTSETAITPKEQGDSMMVLMEFHGYVCQVAEVDPGVIAGILLLLRRCYGFKRHASGQLFYVRAVGIAQLVATWIFHSPKPIYAALLYDLIRYTRLPLSYIKANYDMGIFCFVENVVSVDKHQDLAESLLCVSNRFKESINQDHLSVLYIKLAERLYDLRHAAGYSNLEEVKYMAKETLTVDVELARNYLEAEIAEALEAAVQYALTLCKGKSI